MEMVEMKETIIFKYEYVKTLKMEERMTPKKNIITGENKENNQVYERSSY